MLSQEPHVVTRHKENLLLPQKPEELHPLWPKQQVSGKYFKVKALVMILLITKSITRSFHISKLWQSGWQITTFLSENLYIRLSLAISHSEGFLASESWIYRFYDKKVVICHPLCQNLQMWKLLVILVVIKLYDRYILTNFNLQQR